MKPLDSELWRIGSKLWHHSSPCIPSIMFQLSWIALNVAVSGTVVAVANVVGNQEGDLVCLELDMD